MHNARAYLAFIWRVCLVPFDEVIEVRDVSHGFLRIDVNRFGLFARDVGQGFDLTLEIIGAGAEIRETDFFR